MCSIAQSTTRTWVKGSDLGLQLTHGLVPVMCFKRRRGRMCGHGSGHTHDLGVADHRCLSQREACVGLKAIVIVIPAAALAGAAGAGAGDAFCQKSPAVGGQHLCCL